jgi:hypothetical protein
MRVLPSQSQALILQGWYQVMDRFGITRQRDRSCRRKMAPVSPDGSDEAGNGDDPDCVWACGSGCV